MRFIRLIILLTLALLSAANAEVVQGPYLLNPATDSMTVCWVADTGGADKLSWRPEGGPELSLTDRIWLARDWGGVKLRHHCRTLTGLEPNTTYSYRVESGERASGPYTFNTAPKPGEPFSFVIYGDNQIKPGNRPNPVHREVLAAIARRSPDFLIHTGDFVRLGEELTHWNLFFEEAGAVLVNTPFLPLYGNHERGNYSQSKVKGEEIWSVYFPLSGPGKDQRFYSLGYGNLFMIVLNTEDKKTLSLPEGPQRLWLQNELAKFGQDPNTNLLMMVSHRSAYSWRPGRYGRTGMGKVVLPLAVKAGVDIIWSGHNHHYSRAEISGIQQVVTGGGGAALYDFIDDVKKQPGYKKHAKAHHYCLVEVDQSGMDIKVYAVPGDTLIDQFRVPADPLNKAP